MSFKEIEELAKETGFKSCEMKKIENTEMKYVIIKK